MRRLSFFALSAIALALVPLVACGDETKTQQAGLELIITTDLGVSDMNVVRVEIQQEIVPGQFGSQLIANDFLRPQEVKLPSTFSVAPGVSPDQTVLIRVIGRLDNTPVVLREAQIQVPATRVGALTLTLSSKCYGQLRVDDNGEAQSICADPDESCQPDTGACGPNAIDPATIPDYTPGAENNAALPIVQLDASATDATGDVSTAIPTVQPPTFTPAAGNYPNQKLVVSIAESTPGATIYYTLDGTTPSMASSVYTESLGFSSATTVTAIAFAPGYQASPVTSALYTFNELSGPTTLDFGTILCGHTAQNSQTLTLTNLTAADVSFSTSGSQDFGYSKGEIVPANGTLDIKVTQQGTAKFGANTDVLTIAPDDGSPPVKVNLTYTGQGGIITFSDPTAGTGAIDSLDFGSVQAPANEPISKVVAITNTGNTPITYAPDVGNGGITIAPSSVTIDPGATVTMTVSFQPTNVGDYSQLLFPAGDPFCSRVYAKFPGTELQIYAVGTQ